MDTNTTHTTSKIKEVLKSVSVHRLLYIIIGLVTFCIILCFMCLCAMKMQMYKGDKMDGSYKKDMYMGAMNHTIHSMPQMQMKDMMQDMSANMKGKTGADLEKAFLDDMVPHHQGAIDMALELKKGTTRPELLKMADDIIAAQTKEIEMMKVWRVAWYK